MKKTKIIGLSLLGLFAASSQAAITYVAISNDADSGISAANTYTHLLDFGSSTAAVVNGVTFTQAGVSGSNYSYTSTSTVSPHAGGNTGELPASFVGQGITTLLTDMIYSQGAQQGTPPALIATLTLTGLEAGQTYDLRIYSRRWNGSDRRAVISFNSGSGVESTPSINQNDATTVTGAGFTSANQPYYISYIYTATASGQVTITLNQSVLNENWHLYGLTNQVIPEPSSLVMLSLGLLAVGRRKR